MGGFSIWHWLIVLLVVVLLFGAKKIPEVASGLGLGIKNFKKAIKEGDEEGSDAKEPEAVANTTPQESKTEATTTQEVNKQATPKV